MRRLGCNFFFNDPGFGSAETVSCREVVFHIAFGILGGSNKDVVEDDVGVVAEGYPRDFAVEFKVRDFGVMQEANLVADLVAIPLVPLVAGLTEVNEVVFFCSANAAGVFGCDHDALLVRVV